MQHWFLFSDRIHDSWREAFPDAHILSLSTLNELPIEGKGLVWCSLETGSHIEEVVALVNQHSSMPKVVMRDEPSDDEVLTAIATGALAYCNSRAAPEVLQQIALVLENGGLWVGQSLLRQLVGGANRILSSRQNTEKCDDWRKNLSERETEVALEIVTGASNKEIADHLGISERTVKAHLTAIFEKLHVRDRLQLSLRINGIEVLPTREPPPSGNGAG